MAVNETQLLEPERVNEAPLPEHTRKSIHAHDPVTSSTQRVIGLVGTITIFYLARDFVIPIALALLLSFLLAPLANKLEQLLHARFPAIALSLILALGAIGGIAYVTGDQLINLSSDLPKYSDNIHQRLQSIRGPLRNAVQKGSRMMQFFYRDFAIDLESVNSANPSAAKSKAQPVQLVDANPYRLITSAIGPLLKPIALFGLVLVFTAVMLFTREDLRNRFIRLVGHGQLSRTTQALDDAADRVSRYLIMQLGLNVTVGTVVGLGLFLLGVPNAILWGLLTTLLRFIPYIGVWCAGTLALLMSLSVSESWLIPILTFSLYAVVELVATNILEPWWYGSSTGLSPMAIIVAGVFWTWLWGALGLLISTPLTVCLAVVGRYVPSFSFLYVLLGDAPVLPVPERFYQRLLAHDQDEATEIIETFVAGHPVEAAYNDVIMPALSFSTLDLSHASLASETAHFIQQTIAQVIEDLGEAPHLKVQSQTLDASGERPRVLCVSCQYGAESIANSIVARSLMYLGVEATKMPLAALLGEVIEKLEHTKYSVIFISAMPPYSLTQIRYMVKRISAKAPQSAIIVALWQAEEALKKAQGRLAHLPIKSFVTTFNEALAQCLLHSAGASLPVTHEAPKAA